MPSKPYQLQVFQTSHAGAEPQGGIAGPAPLSPAMGVLSRFKFVQTDILTGNEIHWKVGCLHQWDPLEKALSSSRQQGWPSREPKGKLLSLELGFLLVQGLSDLLVTE